MKRFLAIFLFAGALLACNKTEPQASKLDVGATEILVPSKASVAQFTVTADAAWKVEVPEDWVVASKLSGTGNDVVKLAVMTNTGYSSREATITVTAGSLQKTIKLVQAQMDAIFIDQDKVTVPYTDGTYDFPVQANVVLGAVSDVDWMTIENTKALVDETFTVHVDLNAGRDARIGHITITGEAQEQVITVTQGAFEPEFDLEDEQGVGLWGTLTAPQEGLAGYVFTAVTNMEFYAEAPDADWIHVEKEGNVVTVSIDENPGAARTEYIYMGCYLEEEDYSDYGAMITVMQKGAAQAVGIWNMDFYWGIFPQGTRVSTAVAGDYFVLYSPNAVTPGYHLMNKADGTEASVLAPPVENVTGVTNDDSGNVIVTVGGNFPLKEDWSLDVDNQIPLQVYVMSQADFLAGNYGEPILTYNDGFYGYGLDNAQVNGDAKADGLLTMTSGAAGGGTCSVAWEIKGGVTTDAPTASASSPTDGGDCWDSYHCVTIGAGMDVTSGFYFAGYVGDYNLHFTQNLGADADWSIVYTTGYTWEGAINTGDVFTYDGHRYLAVIGMSYFAFEGWGIDPHLLIFNIDNPASPDLKINETFYANTENWQYGDNTDIEVVEEEGKLVAYVVDVSASTYRKFEIQF